MAQPPAGQPDRTPAIHLARDSPVPLTPTLLQFQLGTVTAESGIAAGQSLVLRLLMILT